MPRVLLCFSMCQAHRGPPLTKVLLCRLAHQSLKGEPWVGSYSVVQCVRGFWASLSIIQLQTLGCEEREAMVMAPPPTCDSAVSPCFHGCLAFLHDLLPHILSIHLSTVNSTPHPGIAPQSLNSSFQPLYLPGDQRSGPGYV